MFWILELVWLLITTDFIWFDCFVVLNWTDCCPGLEIFRLIRSWTRRLQCTTTFVRSGFSFRWRVFSPAAWQLQARRSFGTAGTCSGRICPRIRSTRALWVMSVEMTNNQSWCRCRIWWWISARIPRSYANFAQFKRSAILVRGSVRQRESGSGFDVRPVSRTAAKKISSPLRSQRCTWGNSLRATKPFRCHASSRQSNG